jgi:hypothetical protein
MEMQTLLKLEHNDIVYNEVATARLADVPTVVIGAAVKAHAKLDITAFAETYRSRLANASATKMAEYRIKEEIARDPSSASEAELELLSREAVARGTDRAGLLGQISVQTGAFRQVALLIGALEAEANAAVIHIDDDDPDIETHVAQVLVAAKGEAQEEYLKALALIAGV